MKIVIDVSDTLYKTCKRLVSEGDPRPSESCIANGTPVSTDGDLISRKALKKAIEEVEGNYDGYEPNDLGRFMNKVDDLIDNAPPTVEEPERLKGEWILNKDENPECPYCHHSFTYFGNFCSNCGADLR